MSTLTDNLGLVKHASGYEGWGDDMNANLDKIDAEFNRIMYSSNPIINGDMSNWQRGTFGFAPGFFNADRWRSYAYSGSFTVNRVAFSPGQTDVPGEPEFYMNHYIKTPGDITVEQFIEDVRIYANQLVSFSFWTYVDNETSLEMVLFGQYFGTGGSDAVFTGAVLDNPLLYAGWNYVTGYCNIPSINGKTIGLYSCLSFRIDISPIYTGNWGLSQVSINNGSTSYPFKPRPKALEEILCKRYCQVLNADGTHAYPEIGSGFTTSTSNAFLTVHLPVPMRNTPTLSYSGSWLLTDENCVNYIIDSFWIDSPRTNAKQGLIGLNGYSPSAAYATAKYVEAYGNNDTNCRMIFNSEF
ncbi:hypothetical protein [Methanolacinia petrolearia]|uniref:hypothetical protein n=1 Tax=Methanolacinia petrolearia TaxID=54120 RepID=UPI003BAB48C1